MRPIEIDQKTIVYISCAFAGVAFGIGTLVGFSYERAQLMHFFAQVKPFRNSITGYSYTVPLLGMEAPESTSVGIYTELHESIQSTGDAAKARGELDDYAVYFKNLNSPFWFGINEKQAFLPASLYKLPIALIIYKSIEDGDLNPDKRLVYTPAIAHQDDGALISKTSLVVGRSYPVQDLVSIMLEQSDNGAKSLLGSILDTAHIEKLWTITQLGMPHPNEQISARDYALFFRLLYSATYLNSDDSETILASLTRTAYKNALAAGVPNEVAVAHKWGLYNLTDEGEKGKIELHDCGIVYAPERPYILCVMTKGTSQEKLEKFIAAVSQITYAKHSEY